MTDDAKGEREHKNMIALAVATLSDATENAMDAREALSIVCAELTRLQSLAAPPAQAQGEPTNCFYCAYRLPWHAMTCTRPRTESAASAAPEYCTHGRICDQRGNRCVIDCGLPDRAFADLMRKRTASAAPSAEDGAVAEFVRELRAANTSRGAFYPDDLGWLCNKAADAIDRLTAANAALQARVEAAELDAKRYRWLRENNYAGRAESVLAIFHGDGIDNCIDAAMGADK